MKYLILICIVLFFTGCATQKYDIRFPVTNVYYETTSCDGYAFLGISRFLTGGDWKECYDKMKELRYRLNDTRISNGIKLDSTVIFTYYAWICGEFLKEINKPIDNMIQMIDSIGIYENGMQRYCDVEIYYIVPNVTSAAALMYAHAGRLSECNKMLEVLEKRQLSNGNWRYEFLNKKAIGVQEDDFHLAMMIYHFQELRKIKGVKSFSNMYAKAMYCLKQNVSDNIATGSVGWQYPMVFMVLQNNTFFRDKTIAFLEHKSFRVRAMAAWALAKSKP